MLSSQWRNSIPVTSDPSSTPFFLFCIWHVARDASHLPPPADNHTTSTLLRPALLGAIYWKCTFFFLRPSTTQMDLGHPSNPIYNAQLLPLTDISIIAIVRLYVFLHRPFATTQLLLCRILVTTTAHLLTFRSLLLFFVSELQATCVYP